MTDDGGKSGGTGPQAWTAAMFSDGGIAQFDGEDKSYSSSKWAQDIEDNAEVFNWTAQQKLIIARRSLVGTAGLWLKSEKVFRTYEELKAALVKEFPEAINSKEMHELMAARKKRRDESYYQYMLIMKELGKRAKFPDYVAIQYIIDGIEDHQMYKTVLYGVTTYGALKEKLSIYEKMRGSENKIEGRADPATERKKEASTHDIRRCYNCGENSHLSSQCTKGIKCFQCNEFGHIGKQCPTIGGNTSVKQSAMREVRSSREAASAGQSVKQRSTSTKEAMFGTVDPTNQCACTSSHDSGHLIDTSNTVSIVSSSEVMQINKNKDLASENVRKPVKSIKLAGNHSSNALIDSGSDVNLISAELCAKLFNVEFNVGGLTLTGLGHSKVQSLGKITTVIDIDGQCYNDVTFHIVPKDCMPYDITIGYEFLKSVTVLMSDGCVSIFRNESELINKVNCFTGVTESLSSPSVKQEAYQCLDSYRPVQVKEAPLELKTVLKDDVTVAQMEQGIVEKQMDECLKDGIERVSSSEYSSPLVLVKKKDETTRVCVDYTQLNEKMVKEKYPLPIIDDPIDTLSQAKVFSVLDLKNVSEESILYSSFGTYHGQFEVSKWPDGCYFE